ncbi:MAG: hypothetical protein XE11_0798 [Methanomicrobiales archaeon 53_19]|uniref:hypothetical protein n=1 Tax=Methanocalculus sp. TaxID=2004547 RepID=UPI0007466113|nr:hypothetical protein [Methanocalculus sp.]KUL04213.1 MAG: hypothetical protein XE11_0798 [Methanomicrobiales archaeon 53_19]HIJ07562.1 hypothetical protein [Methanocalculus sp.]
MSSPTFNNSLITGLKNLMEPDNAGPFILLKMAGYGIMHHGLQFLVIVGLGKDRVAG